MPDGASVREPAERVLCIMAFHGLLSPASCDESGDLVGASRQCVVPPCLSPSIWLHSPVEAHDVRVFYLTISVQYCYRGVQRLQYVFGSHSQYVFANAPYRVLACGDLKHTLSIL